MIFENTYLGFDYGTTNIAVGFIMWDGEDWLRDTFYTKLDSKLDPYSTHSKIERFLSSDTGLFEDESVFSPHYAFIESAFKGPNSKTFAAMTRVAHSINIILSSKGVMCKYIDNNTWRKVLFGKGNTKKEVAQAWAYKQWPYIFEGMKKSEMGHQADSIMIAEAGRLLVENGTFEQEVHRP